MRCKRCGETFEPRQGYWGLKYCKHCEENMSRELNEILRRRASK